MSFVVALTLIMLIVGYIGGNDRNWPQRFAYAAVLGIIFVPIWGFFAETWKLAIWTDGRPPDVAAAAHFADARGVQPVMDALASYSTVSDAATVVAWLLASLAALAMDWLWARRRSG